MRAGQLEKPIQNTPPRRSARGGSVVPTWFRPIGIAIFDALEDLDYQACLDKCVAISGAAIPCPPNTFPAGNFPKRSQR